MRIIWKVTLFLGVVCFLALSQEGLAKSFGYDLPEVPRPAAPAPIVPALPKTGPIGPNNHLPGPQVNPEIQPTAPMHPPGPHGTGTPGPPGNHPSQCQIHNSPQGSRSIECRKSAFDGRLGRVSKSFNAQLVEGQWEPWSVVTMQGQVNPTPAPLGNLAVIQGLIHSADFRTPYRQIDSATIEFQGQRQGVPISLQCRHVSVSTGDHLVCLWFEAQQGSQWAQLGYITFQRSQLNNSGKNSSYQDQPPHSEEPAGYINYRRPEHDRNRKRDKVRDLMRNIWGN